MEVTPVMERTDIVEDGFGVLVTTVDGGHVSRLVVEGFRLKADRVRAVECSR